MIFSSAIAGANGARKSSETQAAICFQGVCLLSFAQGESKGKISLQFHTKIRTKETQCTGERPCQRCQAAGEACEYVASRRGYEKHRKSRPDASDSEDRHRNHVAEPEGSPQRLASSRELDYEMDMSQLDDDDPESVANQLQLLSREPRIFSNDLQSFSDRSETSPGGLGLHRGSQGIDAYVKMIITLHLLTRNSALSEPI